MILTFPPSLTLDALAEQLLIALRNATTWEERKEAIKTVLLRADVTTTFCPLCELPNPPKHHRCQGMEGL